MFLKRFEVNSLFLCKLSHLSRYVQGKVDFYQFALDPANPSLGVSRRAPLVLKSGGAAL